MQSSRACTYFGNASLGQFLNNIADLAWKQSTLRNPDFIRIVDFRVLLSARKEEDPTITTQYPKLQEGSHIVITLDTFKKLPYL